MNIKNFFNLEKDLNVLNIMTDSRKKSNNAIFFAIVGLTNDSHNYISQAIQNGAIAVVYSKDLKEYQDDIVYLRVNNVKKCLNDFADYFYGYPSHNMNIYGVTGTNGKTTISYCLYNLLEHFEKTGYIGTLGYGYNDEMFEQHFTTPDINDLHLILKEMKDHDCKNVCLEVSSQGLDLHRTDSVVFDTVMFTNLTHEHLDYHKNFDNYYNAKASLFKNIGIDKLAIINIDDQYAKRLIDDTRCKVITYGIDNIADYQAINLNLEETYSEFDLLYKNHVYHIKTNYVAKYNVYNLLCIIAALNENGYELSRIIPLLSNLKNVPGRLEFIDEGQNYQVLVDYAHTPDGFIKIFDYLKKIKKDHGRLIVLFGMRGSGDKEKRAIIGKICDDICDEIYITADDNHYEDVNDILNDIEKGIVKHKANRFEFREEAIKEAIKNCKKDDILAILCKGEDRFNKINGELYPYQGDDYIAREAIKKTLKK